jgi:hypothetical protein
MTRWKEYDYSAEKPGDRFAPWPGPYVEVVNGYESFSSILRGLADRLWRYETNEDRDIIGRDMTLVEALDIVWYCTRKLCDRSAFQMQDPSVPSWRVPFPWLDFVEKDLRANLDELKKSLPAYKPVDPGTVPPWSAP